MIKAKDLTAFLDKMAPPSLAEDWDNVGLLAGSNDKEVKRVLLSLDVTTKVVDEAIEKKADMIIAHHPLIFKGLKRVTENNLHGKLVYKLLKNDINVFAAHTNLDVAPNNINLRLAQLLGLTNVENMSVYKRDRLFKLAVYAPGEAAEKVRSAMCASGAGWIGNYSDCTFQTKGTGTFKPLEGTTPYIGIKGELARVDEVKIETIVPEGILNSVIKDMLAVHPYEEVAYDVYLLENKGFEYGLGTVGVLEKAYDFSDFIDYVKSCLNLKNVRYTNNQPDNVKKVAIFCGSFDEDYSGYVKKHNADVLITGDLKHHMAIDLIEDGICAVDCGHFGTEKVVVDLLAEMLEEKFKRIEFIRSECMYDPILTI